MYLYHTGVQLSRRSGLRLKSESTPAVADGVQTLTLNWYIRKDDSNRLLILRPIPPAAGRRLVAT
jgi:hypothetical protein